MTENFRRVSDVLKELTGQSAKCISADLKRGNYGGVEVVLNPNHKPGFIERLSECLSKGLEGKAFVNLVGEKEIDDEKVRYKIELIPYSKNRADVSETTERCIRQVPTLLRNFFIQEEYAPSKE